MAEVRLEGVQKSFGDVAVLRDIDLAVRDGEFMVFVGPSGCGKSTLLRAIAGLEEITAGRLFIGEREVSDVPPSERGIAMVFQSYALYPHMSLFDNMAFGLQLARVPKAEIERQVRQAAKVLNIEHLLDRRPKDLSGGQRQRVAIGRAIVRKPQVFLFDEPLSNLDAGLRVRMRYEFVKLHEQLGTTMIYVTHDQVEAMTLADRIVVLSAGRIEQVGTPLELYERPGNLFVAGFIGSPRMNFFAGELERCDAGEALVRLSSGERVRAAADCGGRGPGERVTLGVRPEHFRPGVADNAIALEVSFVEPLGSRTHAYGPYPGADDVVCCELEGARAAASGDRLTLGVAPGRCYLFDGEGRALARTP